MYAVVLFREIAGVHTYTYVLLETYRNSHLHYIYMYAVMLFGLAVFTLGSVVRTRFIGTIQHNCVYNTRMLLCCLAGVHTRIYLS